MNIKLYTCTNVTYLLSAFPHLIFVGMIGKPCVGIKTKTVSIKTKTMDNLILAMNALKRQKEEKRCRTVAKEICNGMIS
jgi:hypothetical protein